MTKFLIDQIFLPAMKKQHSYPQAGAYSIIRPVSLNDGTNIGEDQST